MPYLFILTGLLLLLVGGHFLVTSSVGIALRYKVSTLVIGLTLVSFATSAPELLVSITAALKDKPDIAMGNVFGSNIANIGLILGLTSIIFTLPAATSIYKRDLFFLIFITGLTYFVGFTGDSIYWFEGVILTGILVYYNIKKIRDSRNTNISALESEIDHSAENKPMWQLLGALLLGMIGLKFGADILVMGAIDVAQTYGVSEKVVSLSMVALGTSLPELVASIVAAKKGEKDLAVGNIIGSNIFNLLGVLGITSMIKEITPDPHFWDYDYWWVLGFTLALYPLMRAFRKDNLGKLEGGMLFIAYAVYITLLFVNK